MDSTQIMGTVDNLVSDLLNFARVNNMSPYELLVLVATTEQLLQSVLCSRDKLMAVSAIQEANATLQATTCILGEN